MYYSVDCDKALKGDEIKKEINNVENVKDPY